MAGSSPEYKRLKRSHAVDRLSLLPDNNLHHIISLLDTKSAVRTSLLARRWRCLWKHVPVLNFCQNSFPNLSSFTKHINRVLSLRFHRIRVSSITFDICGDKWGGAMKTFEKIMKYADSHGGGGGLRHLSIIDDKMQFNITDVANVITAFHHHESLETLKLETCTLQRKEFDFRFKLLTTLELRDCSLERYHEGELFDPFGNLPCLNHLKLIACDVPRGSTGFIISGLHLLDLEMQFLSSVNEVLAPKLKSFYWRGSNIHNCLPKLNLPALHHANIHMSWHIPYLKAELAEEENRAFMNFLCGLRKAEYLQLRFDMADYCYFHGEQDYFPLNTIKPLIGPEAPPFTRLNTLKIQCAGQQKLPSLDYEVIRYFLEGSLSTEAKFVNLELVNDKKR